MQRAGAYLEAGADCFYPIMLGDLKTLERLYKAIRAPINVLAPTSHAVLRELEQAGIARVSLGPALFWASQTVMRKIAVELQSYGSFDLFRREHRELHRRWVLSTDEFETSLDVFRDRYLDELHEREIA